MSVGSEENSDNNKTYDTKHALLPLPLSLSDCLSMRFSAANFF